MGLLGVLMSRLLRGLAFGVVVAFACASAAGTTAVGAAPTGATGAAAAAAVGLSERPSRDRPQYGGDDAVVYGIDHVGSQVIVGGRNITTITQGDGTTIPGANLSSTARRDPTTVTWTSPVSSTAWWDVTRLGNGTGFIAVAADGVWRFDLRTRTPVWHHRLGGTATTVSRIRGTGVVLVGGSFRGALVAIDIADGSTADYGLPAVTGRLDVPNAGPTKVYRGEVSPDGRWYVGLGMFTRVGEQPRQQAFELRLGQRRALVAAWHPPAFEIDPDGNGYACGTRLPQFLRDVAWSDDSAWFVLVSTGGNAKPVCDSATQWTPTSDTAGWVSPTCIDTIHSDLVIGSGPSALVLVSGHFKCIGPSRGRQGDPQQSDRFGIALLNADGSVNDWRSDKCRGVGGRVIAAVPGGFAVGYDCAFWGNHERANPDPSRQFPLSRFAFLPFTPAP